MNRKCGKCKGTGKIEKPINMSQVGEEACDLCDGTGSLPEDYESAIVVRLDRIIEILEGKYK